MPDLIPKARDWCCYHIVMATPTRWADWLWPALLPYAGNWAYWWSMTPAERAACREEPPADE